ncbi:MAG: hypothetical protein ACKKL5_01975 [Candidatus Komeilibacteria bacterium]
MSLENPQLNNQAPQAENIETEYTVEEVEWKAKVINNSMGQFLQAKALNLVESITYEDKQAKALSGIAQAQAGQGQIEPALHIARSITHEYYKAEALSGIAQAQAGQGQIEPALHSAESIIDEYNKAKALSGIAQAQAGQGQIEPALHIARSITSEYVKAKVLSGIAQAQVNEDQLDRIVKLAESITHEYYKAKVLSAIAQAQAGQGQIEPALHIAESITNESEKAKVLSAIAQAQAGQGQIEPALHIAESITHEHYKDEALSAIVQAQTRQAAKLVSNNRLDLSQDQSMLDKLFSKAVLHKDSEILRSLGFILTLEEQNRLLAIIAPSEQSICRRQFNFKIKELGVQLMDLCGTDTIDGEQRPAYLNQLEILAQTYHLRLSEYLVGADKLDATLSTEEQAKLLFQVIREKSEYWQDEVNVADPFQAGAETFGYANMFKFIDRAGLSRHDALHNFRQVLSVWQASGLTAPAFYHNILEQVQADGADYDEQGNAHGKLNNLVDNINLDFQATIAEAQQFTGINKLQALLRVIQTPEQIFSSWKMLLKYNEICDLLQRKELLEQLQSLPKAGKEKLFNYVETLAFHPNISLPKVMKFWQDIEGFLKIGDSHTPEALQDRKKPSNYINFPHLDLTGEQLRDALVEGDYDKIQAFAPLSIEYDIVDKKAEQIDLSLAEQILQAVGKRSEGIKGQAKNPAKLFSQLTKLFKRYDIKLIDYLRSEQPDEDFPEAELVIKEARILLADNDMGLPEKTTSGNHYRAKINLKSDPDGVVAGNDTACCMPFGSGKNNVYTFNPVCSLFTLQRQTVDGKWRTVAQSVLTRNIDIKKNIADLVSQMEKTDAKMTDLVDDTLLHDQPGIITCDNIEVAKNFQGNDNIIETIYSDFFREYIQQAGADWDRDKIIIGMGYTDALTKLPDIANTFIPEAPVGYSDNLHNSSYVLDLKTTAGQLAFKKKIINKIAPFTEQASSSLPKGIQPLTFHDALPVSYIEGKAYATNDSLMEYLHNMENALIAKDVNNIAKHRPNMSIKYEDDKGKMHGYLLGYEGRLDKDGEAIIYVSDLASDGNKRAGGSLILGFAQLYKEHYLDKGNLLPIYAQMRDKTSYEIIKKQLDKLSGQLGIKFIMEETGTYQSGGDTMHEVILRPVKE